MTALFIAAPLVAVALVLAGHRIAVERSARHSVESYEHALDVLGDVTKRSDASAPVQMLAKDEVARPHVRPARPSSPQRAARSTVPPIAPPPLARSHGPLVFGDDDLVAPRPGPVTPVTADTVPVAQVSLNPPSPPLDDSDRAGRKLRRAPRAPRPPRSPRSPRAPRAREDDGVNGRRVGAVAALVVVVAGVALGINALVGHLPKSTDPTPPPTTFNPSHSTTTVPRTTTTTLTPSGELAPTSVSPTIVTYQLASSAPYQLSFATSGVCWIGVESSSTGPYLWMKTLGAGESETYAASGPVVVRLGAPGVLSVSINGTPLELPNQVQPYDVSFLTPDGATTSG